MRPCFGYSASDNRDRVDAIHSHPWFVESTDTAMARMRVIQSFWGLRAIAAAGVGLTLVLAGCGGGSGSSGTTAAAGALLASPAAFAAFGNTANTVSITGGTGPFTVRSSDTSLIPVVQQVTGAAFTFVPKNINTAAPVTLTVTDSAGATSAVVVTVTPATIPAGLITVTPASGSLCAGEGNPAVAVATLCSSENGTASVTVKDANGVVIPNRPVRFEALTFGATFAATATSNVFSRIATVNTDANGVATVALRTDVEVTSEAAFLRATDTVSTHRVDSWINVLKHSDNLTALSIIPTTTGFVGHYTSECPWVKRDYGIQGGKPPYAVTLAAGSTLVLGDGTTTVAPGAGVTFAMAGGRFTVESDATTACATSSNTITVTDSVGATITASYTIAPGSNSRASGVTDLAISPTQLSMAADPVSAYCTSGSTRLVITGGTAPYIAAASIPQIATAVSAATTINVSFVSDGKWKLLKGQSASILVLDSVGKVAVATLSCT